MADIFLSYSTKDLPKSGQVAEVLSRQGWEGFWDRNIPVGKSWDRVIEEQLPEAKAVVVLWSKSSVESDWVRTEAHYAHQHKKLFPAKIEKSNVPISFSLVQFADLTDWDGVSVEHSELVKLLDGIKSAVGDFKGAAQQSRRPPLIQTGQSPTKVFVGYARNDRSIAEKLVSGLEQQGFSLWWDPDIPIGASFEDSIVDALESSKAVVIIWSSSGVQSNWVQAEARWALERSKLVGVTTEAVSVPVGLGVAPTIDLREWDGSSGQPAFNRLLNTISGFPEDAHANTIRPALDRANARKRSMRLRLLVVGGILLFILGLILGVILVTRALTISSNTDLQPTASSIRSSVAPASGRG